MSWESLPHEIHVLILNALCADIISDLKNLCVYVCDWVNTFADADGWKVGEFKYSTGKVKFHPPLTWPAIPTALKSFISAITTCREFNDIILNQIKIDGTHPSDALKIQQAKTIRDITCFPYKFGVSIDMPFFYLAAGAFWKNPVVIGRFRYISRVLRWSIVSSHKMLLPLLEPWLHRHFPEVPDHTESIVRQTYYLGNHSVNPHYHFDVKPNPKRVCHEGRQYISNVDSIAFQVGPNRSPPTLMEQDLLASPPGQWWLFVPYLDPDFDQLDWVLINYKDERMYVGPNPSEALVWKGRDSFLVGTWVRFRTMAAIEVF
jgi:hypothetical protein